ncbi:MAG: spermidine/putrescine ABC transporter ATP-binding protein PotA [Legionellales bacterium]|nr:spermidine/putrescine ABC transporter ATP-binding protein PotA [Legionellales bacterium]|tara:strand:+ start:19931 stop:21025 length:1095 start_codon:yes stop_codon:yes gene_type:complete
MSQTIIEFSDISKAFDDEPLFTGFNLAIERGEFFTLLGPSGCGKTTLLRMVAGFSTPDEGRVLIDGKDVTRLSPQARHVHTVFQSYALFPHLDLFENVAFGLRCQGVPDGEVSVRVTEALERVKLGDLSQRLPHQLSGGQQQRVAIARAVVNRPLALLLDEPLGALDYHLRKTMQIELKQLQRRLGIAFVFVTHDQEEALSLSDRVAVLHEGKLQQLDTPRKVYEEPSNLTVAQFIGETNIFPTTVLAEQEQRMTVTIEDRKWVVDNKNDFAVGEKVNILIRPEDLRVWDENEVDDTTDMFHGRVEEVIYKGSTVDLCVRLDGGKLLYATEFFDEDDDTLVYSIGERVWVNWISGWEVILPHEA